tara:strand:+ start:16369 stop:16626 length:258 start_codon:yes stop_codon:yes gene_type:complete
MSEDNEEKTYRYLVTLRWYVETDEELVAGAAETDDKILDIVRHRSNGTTSCSTCPTRNQQGYAILPHHDFMGNKPVYITTEKITE